MGVLGKSKTFVNVKLNFIDCDFLQSEMFPRYIIVFMFAFCFVRSFQLRMASEEVD